MVQFKRSILSVALVSALQAAAANAQAQADEADAQTQTASATQAEAEKKDEEAVRVEVTGIRASIEKSIDTKKESTEIIEAISAEDIGKLPDVSIADTIARLPGVTAQRGLAGRSSQINVRGMPDFFSTTLMNGREQVSVSMHRGAEYDQYPSELINQVVLYKTPNASLVGQGLSGTVDLRTGMPLDKTERVVSAGVRLEQNENGQLNPEYDDTGERYSFAFIDQFMDGKVGVSLGYAHLGQVEQSNTWEAWGGDTWPTATIGGETGYVLGGSKVKAVSGDNQRDGLVGVLQIKPNDSFESVVDVFYSQWESEQAARWMETPLAWSGATLTSGVIEGGIVTSGTFTGARPVAPRNDANTWDDESLSVGWKNTFQFSDSLTGVIDIATSKASRDQRILEVWGTLPTGTVDTVTYTMHPDGYATYQYGLDYADPSNLMLQDPGGWGGVGFDKHMGTEDQLDTFRAALEHKFESGWISNIEGGVVYNEREKSRYSDEYYIHAPGYVPGGPDSAPIPAGAVVGAGDTSFFGNTNIVALDIGAIPYVYVPFSTQNPSNPDVQNKNWTVSEEITTFFVQVGIDAEWGVPVRGNFGLQYVMTDQHSDGANLTDMSNPAPLSGGASYEETLPSLNLSFELADDQFLRFGLARQMARPRLDDMRANINVGICTTCGPEPIYSGGGGNPQLMPWLADAVDLTYEIYFAGNKGYFAVNTFYKDLQSYIFNQTVDGYDYGTIDPASYPPGTILPTSSVGRFSGPVNGQGGDMSGYELALSVPFELMTPALEGFGLIANYSQVDSNIDANGPAAGGESSMPGLSENMSNLTLYYERSGFSARISQRYRDDFLGEVQGFGGDLSQRRIHEETIVDAQVGYAFQDGSALEGLSLVLQAYNLTDEPYREYFPREDGINLPRYFADYGTTYLIGANYTF